MTKGMPFFIVWQGDEDEQYWNQYDTLEDAVSSEGCKEVDVFKVEPKYLGCYNSSVKTVLTKKKGK